MPSTKKSFIARMSNLLSADGWPSDPGPGLGNPPAESNSPPASQPTSSGEIVTEAVAVAGLPAGSGVR